MNTAAALILFGGLAAYLVARRRKARPWVYVAASVPISIAVYIGLVAAMAIVST